MSWWRRERKSVAQSTLEETGGRDWPLIRLEHIGKTFKGDQEDTVALDDITLDISRGEYVSVSGPSGCGKSTFLSMLALLDTPTSGRYWLSGRATDRLKTAERARVRNLDVGLIFQSFNLIGDIYLFDGRIVDTPIH